MVADRDVSKCNLDQAISDIFLLVLFGNKKAQHNRSCALAH